MLRGRVAEVVAVSALATVITLMIAAPVLRAPSERVFGMEIVGRHHDPFTVMEQFERPVNIGLYSQPVTDIAGALVARVAGAVAAYNWLVLLTFPLAAAAAYLLARNLALSPAGATVAALAYAFAPFHLAHAAYHPHIAQTQWIPLYLLALWRCLDDATPAAVGFLGAATIAVTLSNFYGGMIAAVVTPAAVAAYWLMPCPPRVAWKRRLGFTVGTLALIAAGGMAYAWFAARPVILNREAFAFPRADLFRYSAKWWSYLVPPVEHPLLGAAVSRFWNGAGVHEGLLEQQVSLGWSVVTLGLVAVFRWSAAARNSGLTKVHSAGQMASLSWVPVLVIVAVTALVCSLSPERTIGWFTFVRPSAVLYDIVPMFRSYARFGVVVQLMAALLAGIGVDRLRRSGTRRGQIACLVLLAFAVGEYAVAPSAMWRDVLPTRAHRWVARQPDYVRALDCTPLDQESESVQWLTGGRVRLLGGVLGSCADANLSRKLAANGYTHVIVRGDSAGGRMLGERPVPDGLRVAARFDDSEVFAVVAQPPGIYTAEMAGFFPREHDAEWSWRWMGDEGAWTVVNTGDRPIVADLDIEMSAFQRTHPAAVFLDGRAVQTLVVEPARRIYHIGPITMPPGDHVLAFHPAEAPTVAGDVVHNGDPRRLSVAVGTWTWRLQRGQP